MERRTFEQLRGVVYEKSGISLGDHKEALVNARVGKRMRSLRINDFTAYFDYLVADKSGGELVQRLDVISTNVTHFFRESQHFDVLAEILKQWTDQRQKRMRLWCAAALQRRGAVYYRHGHARGAEQGYRRPTAGH